jgi:hypothetical protein
LTRIPAGPNSAAQARVSVSIAPLVELYSAPTGMPSRAIHEPRLMITPPPAAIMAGATAAVRKNGALTSQLGLANPATEAIVAGLYDRWHAYLLAGVTALIDAGEIDATINAAHAASAILTAVTGGATILQATGRIDFLDVSLTEAMNGLGAAHPPATDRRSLPAQRAAGATASTTAGRRGAIGVVPPGQHCPRGRYAPSPSAARFFFRASPLARAVTAS